MTESQFLSAGMVGRNEKGMPAWAGFLSPDELQAIYQYVKARSVAAVDTGNPSEWACAAVRISRRLFWPAGPNLNPIQRIERMASSVSIPRSFST